MTQAILEEKNNEIDLIDYSSIIKKDAKDPESLTINPLKLKISQEMVDLFTSSKCTDDYNAVHNKEKFRELKYFQKIGLEKPLIPGFMLAAIPELIGNEVLKKLKIKNSTDYELNIEELNVAFGLPSIPNYGEDEEDFIVADKEASFDFFPAKKELHYIIEGPKIRKKKKGRTTSTKIKNQSFKYLESKDLTEKEFEGDKKFQYSRELTLEHLHNYFKSLKYGNLDELFVPQLFITAGTVSNALLKYRDEKKLKTALYKQLNIKYFKAINDYELGKLENIVEKKENNDIIVSTIDKDKRVLAETKTRLKYVA